MKHKLISQQEPEKTPTPPPKIWSLSKAKTNPPPKPRGRFVQLGPSKENLRVLLHPESKQRLSQFINTSSSQADLFSQISAQFRGERETPTWKEVSSVLQHHGLLAAFENKERAALYEGLIQHRCSLDKLSKVWSLQPVALKKRIETLGLKGDFDKLRKRFAAEILNAPKLNQQLRVWLRPGYVRDLGIAFALRRQLLVQLKSLLAQLPPEFETPEMQLQALARKHKLDKSLLSLVVQQLKIF